MLGSFPPAQKRWSMDFFYPNWINDMWRIIGTVFFYDKEHFIIKGEKKFDKKKIVEFCTERGIGLSETASDKSAGAIKCIISIRSRVTTGVKSPEDTIVS